VVKLAFNTLSCPDWSLERVAAAARTHGFQGVELRLIDGDVITPDLVWVNRATIRRHFPGDPMVVALAHATRLSSDDPSVRQRDRETTAALIELAADLEVPMIRVFGGQPADGVGVERAVSLVADGLNALSEDAERAGVTVMLETHDAFCRSEVVATVMARVPSRAIGVHWDVQNTTKMGEEPEQALRALGDRLVHVHVKDARRSAGEWERVAMGSGDVPVAEAVQLLQAHGYVGYLGVEIEKKWHPEYPEPDVILPQYAAELRRYLGQAASS
jgi:fatty-acyl-CoA synthase